MEYNVKCCKEENKLRIPALKTNTMKSPNI